VAPEADSQQLELLDYLRVLWRRKWTILVIVLVAVGAGLGFSKLQTKKYTATAEVIVQPSGTPAGAQVNSNTPGTVSADQVSTQVQVVQSAPVRDLVLRRLGSAPKVSVSSPTQTDVIDIAATSTNPRQAANTANAYANAYVDFSHTQAVNALLPAAQQIQAQIDGLNAQIAALDARVASSPTSQRSQLDQSLSPQRSALANQVATFKAQLAQVQLNSAITTGSSQILALAAPPTSPSSPRIVTNTLVALAFGLVIGIAAAFLRDNLDDSVKTKQDLERSGATVPVLGLIPSVTEWRNGAQARAVSLTDPASPGAEAYRTLRNSIQFHKLEHQLRTLQVTSPSSAEGKTTTVVNLGVALARAGQHVVIVCCDLRRPRLHDFFGMSNRIGFTSVLWGDVALKDAVQFVPRLDHLAVLPSGPVPADPSELLVSQRAADIFASLMETADILLVDSPPILPVSDAAALSARMDGLLLVVTPGTTTRKQVARAVELLDQVEAPLLGTVLNGVSGAEHYGYPYAYASYSTNGADPAPDKPRVMPQHAPRIPAPWGESP
jgi:succinoglycan biosynthesis transport protein ExoP